jgi:hypothetical protein
MRSLDLAIQLWRAALDIRAADAEILDMSVEFGLELKARCPTVHCTAMS